MSARSGPESLGAYLEVEDREARRPDRETWLKMARQFWIYRGIAFAGLLLIFLGTAAALTEPRLFGYAIDEAIVPGKWDSLRKLVVLYLLVGCVRVVATIAQSYLF